VYNWTPAAASNTTIFDAISFGLNTAADTVNVNGRPSTTISSVIQDGATVVLNTGSRQYKIQVT
jgi:hypothetical protein